ncbi:MAG TPA: sensor histidine kinase [Candidatus Dormibacteraeota bacterium]|nr:sensor histidine kinase [Candidatus Dormibacteraeota bacterium]
MSATTAPAAATPQQWRLREWPGRLFDVGIVVGLLLVGIATVFSGTHEIPPSGAGRIPLLVVTAVPLAALLLRRRHPLLTLGVILVALLVAAALGSSVLVHPLVLVGVYTVAARMPWRLSLLLTVASLAVLVAGAVISREGWTFAESITTLIPVGAAYVVGIYTRTRLAYVDSLRAQAHQATREQELRAQQAVAEERVRIARELHDVIAHHLSLITVQAGALQTQLPQDHPGHATAATMARTGRQAMDEMRRMLGLLRLGTAEVPGHAPQPGIAEIPTLVAQARAAGVDVELVIDDSAERPIPLGVDLSAFRIVQEAVTNVIRHAGNAHCRVRIHVGSDVLELRITDDGASDGEAITGTGHGLVGMRERVALFGGELFAGPVPGGGFAVRATLPLSSDGTG